MNMRKLVVTLIMAAFCISANAQQQQAVPAQPQETMTADDFTIVKDEVIDGVRYVTATPSAKVCSNQIDIQIKDGVILSVVYTRGCNGNAKGIGALIKGMSVEEAIRRLDGITCGKRPTSCPDQLARVLKSLK